MKVDLHLHTTASDGILSPKRLLRYVKLTKHELIAITDHDTVDGIKEGVLEGERLGVDVIPGVEISTYKDGKEHHILGYYFDWRDSELEDLFASMKQVREDRIKKILNNLFVHFNIRITFEELSAHFNVRNYGRPHIALVLFKKGLVENIQQAFDLYLYDDGPCNVGKLPFSSKEAVDIIHRKGGIAILAHPGIHIAQNTDMLDEFIEMGMDGIEVFHPSHTPELAEMYLDYANERDLIVTGGSDYHGYLNEDVFTLNIDLTQEQINKMLAKVRRPLLYL